MERVAVVGFAAFLLLVCLYWTYGYIRRRSKKRFLPVNGEGPHPRPPAGTSP